MLVACSAATPRRSEGGDWSGKIWGLELFDAPPFTPAIRDVNLKVFQSRHRLLALRPQAFLEPEQAHSQVVLVVLKLAWSAMTPRLYPPMSPPRVHRDFGFGPATVAFEWHPLSRLSVLPPSPESSTFAPSGHPLNDCSEYLDSCSQRPLSSNGQPKAAFRGLGCECRGPLVRLLPEAGGP